MKKNILAFIKINILSFIVTYILNFFLRNNFFVFPIIITYVILFIIGIIALVYLYFLYQNKIDYRLQNIKELDIKHKYYQFDKLSLWFRKIYFILILFPIGLSIYIDKVPKYIYTIEDFINIKNNPDGHYILMNDLDLANKPIEKKYYNWCWDSNFNGVFDGNNKTLYNVNDTLFFCTEKKAVIKDLNIYDVNLTGRYAKMTGVIANENYGLISNVHIKGIVNGYDFTGGFVGSNRGKIDKSSFEGEVQGINYVGGIAGINYSEITNSYAQIKVYGKQLVGGITGESGWKLENTYATGYVEGKILVGGLVGLAQLHINNVYTNTEVHGDKEVGGLFGSNWYEVKNCISYGDTYGNEYVGGISGSLNSDSKIENCLVYGDVFSNSEFVDGITNNRDDSAGLIINGYIYEGQKINDIEVDSTFIVTKEMLLDENWYKDILKLNLDIWDLSYVNEGYFPKLKNIDNQEDIKIN